MAAANFSLGLRLRLVWTLTALTLAASLSAGCLANFGGDRCYVSPERHAAARRLYDRSGSLELTRDQLVRADWLSCEIEQTIYRLHNETAPAGGFEYEGEEYFFAE